MIKQFKVTVTGTMPLLMHSERLSDPQDEYSKAMKKISGKRNKTDDDHDDMARLEFLGGLYLNSKGVPYIPSFNLHACLVEAAKINKNGKNVKAFVSVTGEGGTLTYKGPKNAEKLADKPEFRDRRSVRVGTARVMRTRPRFNQWAAEFDVEFETTGLDEETVRDIIYRAGRIGLGDFRQFFGKFDSIIEEVT